MKESTPMVWITPWFTSENPQRISTLQRKVIKRIGIIAAYKAESIDRINRVAFDYTCAVEKGGGTPYIIPCNVENTEPYIDEMDGFIFPGGTDIHPWLYGESITLSESPVRENDEFLRGFMVQIIERKKKILWICKGMQLMNIVFWWTLHQHIQNASIHNQYERQYEHVDTIAIESWSFLEEVFWENPLPINSLHHQAIDTLWEDLRVVARSSTDGTIEAIEHGALPLYWVQWHPECLLDHGKLFKWFIQKY